MTMTKILKATGVLMLLIVGQIAFGQSNSEEALLKAQEAIKLMDNGKIEESIVLLEEAQKLDPNRFDYPPAIVGVVREEECGSPTIHTHNPTPHQV